MDAELTYYRLYGQNIDNYICMFYNHFLKDWSINMCDHHYDVSPGIVIKKDQKGPGIEICQLSSTYVVY